jgi:hypothetical protein
VKYMLLIFNRTNFLDELSEQERTTLFGEVDEILRDLRASGELVRGHGLAEPAKARTITQRNGETDVTDGPFLESKEQFAGYTMVECATIERAVEIGARWPDLRYGGTLEVREVVGGTD